MELLAETNDSPLSSAPNDSPRLELLEKSAQHALAADRTSEVETCSLSSAPDSGPRSELVEESVQMIAAARNVSILLSGCMWNLGSDSKNDPLVRKTMACIGIS